MSDLLGGAGSAAVSNGRAQNGGARGPIPVPQPQYRGAGVRTPTDIMRGRAEREARRKAERESEARQRARNDDQVRPQDTGLPTGIERRDDTAGVAPTEPRRRSGDPTSTRRSAEAPGNRTSNDRRSGERRSGGDPKSNQPIINQQPDYKTTPIGPQSEHSSAANTTTMPQSSRRRGTSLSQDQPRPVQPSGRAASATYNPQTQQTQTRNTSTAAMESQSQPKPANSTAQTQPQSTQETNGGTQSQRGTVSSFPHAFERWETLSSHWEGLTSYWIRRLQNNSDEMNREPLNQQMARQVTDLSAAGANLFHAVVELQRLRASSERKFQRWFFDTRAEQERAREVQARLENDLRNERQARAEAVAELNSIKSDDRPTYQDRGATDQMVRDVKAKDLEVKEMRRELQISKEEARRAWEELGRREQEERDRTTSLRAGEPTLVGGVQVVPMLQGAVSRQTSQRPSTRDGPLPAPPSRSGQQSVESPLDEPGVTHYDPARSETDTDPFTENGRVAQQPVHAPMPQQQTSNGSSSAVQAARSASQAAPQMTNSIQPQSTSAAGGTYLRYGPAATAQPATSSFYQHEGSSLLAEGEQARIAEPDDRSFVPSNEDTFSEEEFEYDGNGNVRRDAQGNPVVYGRGAGSEDSDEDDVQEQMERERMYSQHYGSGLSGVEYGSGPTATAGPGAQSGRATAQVYGSPVSPEDSTAPVDYSGSAYGSGLGWEAVPRHHHPTRLSDVLEEDERSRTSASRASQTSRGLR